MILYYTIFFTVLTLSMVGHCWLSVKTNTVDDKRFWMIIQWFYGMICVSPIWIIISSKSKDIVFDGLLYDILVGVAYVVFLLIFSKQIYTLNWVSILGIILCIIGLVLFKIGSPV